MRVIVATGLNSGEAEYKNMGDVAMLQVAVARLFNLWPDAHIEVLTDSGANLAKYCPGALPRSRPDCACWLSDHFFLGRFQRLLPKWAAAQLSVLKQTAGFCCPSLMEFATILRLNAKDLNGVRKNLEAFLSAVRDCDLFVVCGSGGFADSCRQWNLFILGAMTAALRRGKLVAMFGQGIGPLDDPLVLSWAKHVLPSVTLIALRGTRGGKDLLEETGVDPSSIVTTGDEAIELSNAIRSKEQGTAVGVNLRVASYAGVEESTTKVVGSVLREFARQHHVSLLPIPIAMHDYADDRKAIRQLLTGFNDESDGGSTIDTPQKLLEQTARCRIVVTGAYHAAVFALAQGIPAVCLSNSAYYLAKFDGLEDLFKVGCTTITLDDPQLEIRLTSAMEKAWNSVDHVRSALLHAAAIQIEKGHSAYRHIKRLVDPSNIESEKYSGTETEPTRI
jgi:polysaccharide pyruvyl transferase WcaK-like protein